MNSLERFKPPAASPLEWFLMIAVAVISIIALGGPIYRDFVAPILGI